MLDIFRQDAFGVVELTDAMREIKFVPGFVGRKGLFTTTSISTLDVAIEKDAARNLLVIPSAPRGGPGVTVGKNKRSMRKLSVPHFPAEDGIDADEVQGVRAFGDEYATQFFQDKIAERAADWSNSFAITEEVHRVKLITTGQFLDSDGSVIFNYFTEFGETQPSEIDFDLDNATPAEGVLRKQCASVTRSMAATLDGLPFNGIMALCGDAFYDDLIAHREVRETYKGYDAAAQLRQGYLSNDPSGTFGEFPFGGILWVNYRGSYGGSPFVGTDKCHFVPMGTPNLFRTVYAPANYIQTVNRPGQRLYAMQLERRNQTGVDLHYQMNALHYCTRPRVLLRGKRT